LTRGLLQIVLLPGLDGTGDLFADFIATLPEGFEAEVVRYPTDVYLSYAELASVICSAVPAHKPFVLVAESFSTPLAIQYAATKPSNLKGLVLVAGFASSPVRGWRRFMASILPPIAFRFPLPEFVCRLLLVGLEASPSLVAAVRLAVSSVRPNVLAARMCAVLVCDVRAELAQVGLPILYIQAKQDRLVDASCLREIVRIQPETSVIAVSGPHLLVQREPAKTAEIVAEFVGQFKVEEK